MAKGARQALSPKPARASQAGSRTVQLTNWTMKWAARVLFADIISSIRKPLQNPAPGQFYKRFFCWNQPASELLSGLAKLLARVFTLLTLHERHGFSTAHS